MPFMQPEITGKQKWVEYSDKHGDINVGPLEDFNFNDFTEVNTSISILEGFGCRMQAPGYLDCTDWTVCDTEEEAKKLLMEYHDLDENLEPNINDES